MQAAAERGMNPPPTRRALRGVVEAEKGSSHETKRARHVAFPRSLDSVLLYSVILMEFPLANLRITLGRF